MGRNTYFNRSETPTLNRHFTQVSSLQQFSSVSITVLLSMSSNIKTIILNYISCIWFNMIVWNNIKGESWIKEFHLVEQHISYVYMQQFASVQTLMNAYIVSLKFITTFILLYLPDISDSLYKSEISRWIICKFKHVRSATENFPIYTAMENGFKCIKFTICKRRITASNDSCFFESECILFSGDF